MAKLSPRSYGGDTVREKSVKNSKVLLEGRAKKAKTSSDLFLWIYMLVYFDGENPFRNEPPSHLNAEAGG